MSKYYAYTQHHSPPLSPYPFTPFKKQTNWYPAHSAILPSQGVHTDRQISQKGDEEEACFKLSSKRSYLYLLLYLIEQHGITGNGSQLPPSLLSHLHAITSSRSCQTSSFTSCRFCRSFSVTSCSIYIWSSSFTSYCRFVLVFYHLLHVDLAVHLHLLHEDAAGHLQLSSSRSCWSSSSRNVDVAGHPHSPRVDEAGHLYLSHVDLTGHLHLPHVGPAGHLH